MLTHEKSNSTSEWFYMYLVKVHRNSSYTFISMYREGEIVTQALDDVNLVHVNFWVQ